MFHLLYEKGNGYSMFFLIWKEQEERKEMEKTYCVFIHFSKKKAIFFVEPLKGKIWLDTQMLFGVEDS